MVKMGAKLNKFRQIFNLFLTLALVCVAVGIFVYFLTTPEQRRATTFWMSMGLLLFSAVLSALFASRVVLGGDSRQAPHTFTQCLLVGMYVLCVIALSIVNAFVQFSTLNYFLLHLAGGLVFLLPLQFVGMAGLKSAGQKQEVRESKDRLGDASTRLNDLLSRIETERRDAVECLPPVRKLADNLLYAEPSRGDRASEQALDKALDELQVKGEMLLSSPEKDLESRVQDMIRAALAADRALKTRNDAIVRGK